MQRYKYYIERSDIMKKFVDRFQELETLENEYNSNSSSFVVLYGRRRIGKTELLNEFSRDKKCIRFLATEESEKMNREAFSSIVSEYTSNSLIKKASLSWEELFDFIIDYNTDDKKLIIIDEFQYIGKSNPSFISVLQKIWDTKLKNNNVMLVLCGSLINMMYSQTLSYDSPLYGRRTKQIRLKQIPFKYYKEFIDSTDEKFLIEAYSVTGGVPKYIEMFESNDDIYTAIRSSILNSQSYLYEEPEFLLKNEVQEVGSYYSIIKTIASGCEQLSDISNALEIKATNLPKYLKVLIDLDIIERVVPITEDKPEKSKMGLYKIKDNYIRFWFKFVYPYKSYIESEHIDFVLDKIKEGFIKNHVAYVYEDICKNQYLPELIIKNAFGFTPTKIGKWWDRKDTEIDIVATDNSNNIIFGECKYTKKPLDVNVYYDLLEKVKKVNWNKQNRNEYFVFFCINGYTEKMQNLAKGNSNIVLY